MERSGHLGLDRAAHRRPLCGPRSPRTGESPPKAPLDPELAGEQRSRGERVGRAHGKARGLRKEVRAGGLRSASVSTCTNEPSGGDISNAVVVGRQGGLNPADSRG